MLVAYSGGYVAAASSSHGGLGRRVRGVVLLDALYGELDTFASWLEKDRSAFLVSAYLGSTLDKNAELSHRLTARGIEFSSELGKYVQKGSITILPGFARMAAPSRIAISSRMPGPTARSATSCAVCANIAHSNGGRRQNMIASDLAEA